MFDLLNFLIYSFAAAYVCVSCRITTNCLAMHLGHVMPEMPLLQSQCTVHCQSLNVESGTILLMIKICNLQ